MKVQVAVSVILLSVAAAAHGQDYAAVEPQELSTIQLNVGIHLIQAQLALTPQQHRIGLMFRRTMAANEGMFFAFPEVKQQCLWMKDTILPLSAAFIVVPMVKRRRRLVA